MKHLNLILLLFVITLLSCDNSVVSPDEELINPIDQFPQEKQNSYQTEKCCSCLEEQGISDKYTFPFTMEEIKNLPSYTLKLAACQIPEDTLINMCTFGLVDTYYDFPFISTASVHDSKQNGIRVMESTFNGFRELVQREDGADKLMQKYENAAITDTVEFMHIETMEITMAYSKLCKNYSAEEQKRMVRLGLKKFNEKKALGFSKQALAETLYLLGCVLYYADYQPFVEFVNNPHNNIGYFISGYPMGANLEILEFAEMFLEENG